MMKTAIAGMIACLAAVTAPAETWVIDSAHSSAQFAVRHMMVSTVRGDFSKLSGTVEYDPAKLSQSRIQATIDISTINTREPGRDKHLKSADFFDVEKFPTMDFTSKKVEQAGAGKLKVTGDLTMHGVTREVVLDVEGPSAEVKHPKGAKTGATATTKINRKDFGLTWNRALEMGGVTVGDEVSITIDLELNKKLPTATEN